MTFPSEKDWMERTRRARIRRERAAQRHERYATSENMSELARLIIEQIRGQFVGRSSAQTLEVTIVVSIEMRVRLTGCGDVDDLFTSQLITELEKLTTLGIYRYGYGMDTVNGVRYTIRFKVLDTNPASS